MQQRDTRAYLYDISAACTLVQQFTSGKTLPEYCDNAMLKSAVERQFEIIGEALNNLKQADIGLFNKITEGSRIIAFRNRLIHGYATVSDEVVFGVIQSYLPVLAKEVSSLLKEQESAR